jgi:hypothetical protein
VKVAGPNEFKLIDPHWPARPAPAEKRMNIYDVLRRCTEASNWYSEDEKREAVRLIDQLEANNVLGTTAASLRTDAPNDQ